MAGVATNQVDAAVRQLSDGNTNGTILGQSPTDVIGFYGLGAGVVQASGPGQAAIIRGQACGAIATIATTQSPTAVAPNTSAEVGLTVQAGTNLGGAFQIASGDMLYVNKPTAQAGLGLGNVRISAGNVMGVTFSNFTAATITPTATQKYTIVALRGFGNLSAALTPAAVAPNSIVEQQFIVPGLRFGSTSLVQVQKPTAQAGLDIVGCRSIASNTLGITFSNVTAAVITPTAAESYTIFEMSGIDAMNNAVQIDTLQSPTATSNTVSAAEQAFTVTGVATTDTVIGVTKPTAQANIGIIGWRVSAANSVGITFGNFAAATTTPTASEVYGVQIYRPNPVAPMVVYTQTLNPVSVAANTTAEQTFNVNGLIVNSPVWVNKPSYTNGLGIAGVRVSAANTLAINFANATSAAIVPPAETYVIGNFQIPIPDAGSVWKQTAASANQAQSILNNSMRAAQVNLGLIAGA